MERSMNFGCVFLTIVFIALTVNAQPLSSNVDNKSTSNLPPMIFPKENVTIGAELPPVIFPTENITFSNSPITLENGTVTIVKPKDKSADIPPRIFPKTNGSVPLIELPPLIFPDDNKTFTVIPPINKTALKIMNDMTASMHEDMHILPNASFDDDYYREDSGESSDLSDEVEEVQPIDKSPQSDNLEENYKSDMHILTHSPINEFDENADVDHPMLKNTHILGIIGGVLAVLCACLYLGIIIWRRMIFNRYGMRERLINEDDFYSNKSIRHNF